MRAAEMVLIEAEALARQGKNAEAATVMAELMKNRQPSWNAASVNVNDVLLQRRIELWGEGFSYFDLKRNNKGIDRNYEGSNHLAGHLYTIPAFDVRWTYQIPRAGRPILYTGVDPGAGGHAFVFDGIDADGKIHVNWGWDGEGNGFYDIADLNPTDAFGNPGSDHFNFQQSMAFGFKCQAEPDPDERYTSLWCSDYKYELTLNGKILGVKSSRVYNYNFLYFYGAFGLFFENQDGNHEKDTFLLLQTADQIGVATFFGYESLDNSVFLNKVPEGHYRLYLASKAVNENNYQPVRCPGGVQYYDIDISAAGITMSEAKILGPSTPTGITTVTDKARVDDAIYNLQGQKVQDLPSRHGIYIQNGKKYVK